jgi:hypothetical protein
MMHFARHGAEAHKKEQIKIIMSNKFRSTLITAIIERFRLYNLGI